LSVGRVLNIHILFYSHPSHPEPDVAIQHFSVKKWAKKNGEINVEAIEK